MAAFELPELMMTARATVEGTRCFDTITGAPQTLFVVKTPAAVASRSDTNNARSGLPLTSWTIVSAVQRKKGPSAHAALDQPTRASSPLFVRDFRQSGLFASNDPSTFEHFPTCRSRLQEEFPSRRIAAGLQASFLESLCRVKFMLGQLAIKGCVKHHKINREIHHSEFVVHHHWRTMRRFWIPLLFEPHNLCSRAVLIRPL